jgi:hypothetical protein
LNFKEQIKNSIHLNLTDEEKTYLTIEMNQILRDYNNNYSNNDMASAFNKVFKALTGKDYSNYK